MYLFDSKSLDFLISNTQFFIVLLHSSAEKEEVSHPPEILFPIISYIEDCSLFPHVHKTQYLSNVACHVPCW